MSVYIPAIGPGNIIDYFEAQCVSMFLSSGTELNVTGKVGNDILDCINLSVDIIRFNTLSLQKTIDFGSLHFHFTNGHFLKEGSSAGLGIFISLANELGILKDEFTSKRILATGEIDLFGNVYEVGGLTLKKRAMDNNNFDCFIYPGESKENNNRYLPISSIRFLLKDNL